MNLTLSDDMKRSTSEEELGYNAEYDGNDASARYLIEDEGTATCTIHYTDTKCVTVCDSEDEGRNDNHQDYICKRDPYLIRGG
jgi:hypothetical protein